MKKLLSLMLALMMLAIPALCSAESTMLYGSTWAADDQAMMQNALDAGRRVNYTISFSDLGKGLVPDADVEGIINDVLGALKFTGNGCVSLCLVGFSLELCFLDVCIS